MATYALGRVRTSSTGNPITFSYTVAVGDTVIGLLLKVDGGTDRAGGAPTFGPYPFTQASTTQKAAVTPEASAEAWYLLNPYPGTLTLTIPNTGGLTIYTTVVIAQATAGATMALVGTSGSNNTSTNPAPGALISIGPKNAAFSVVATGAQTWAPSAQFGVIIANTDDGTTGGGEQYATDQPIGTNLPMNWTFGTSDDWGAVSMMFSEVAPNALENYHDPKCVSAGVVSVGGIG